LLWGRGPYPDWINFTSWDPHPDIHGKWQTLREKWIQSRSSHGVGATRTHKPAETKTSAAYQILEAICSLENMDIETRSQL
jgi:hypothetical protein